MYLFFDTETTGLPLSWDAPLTRLSNWPRMVQLAWVMYDKEGQLLSLENHIIQPEGYVIPPDVSRIHGITQQIAMAQGKPLSHVLAHFAQITHTAELLIAHNMQFDEKIVGAEFLRKKMPNVIADKPKSCTMLGAMDYCAIPGKYGFKWPKLSELHIHLFQTDFTGAHNALADVEATAKCFWELRKRGVM